MNSKIENVSNKEAKEKSIENLLKEGWEIIEDIDLSENDESIINLNARSNNLQSENLTNQHLKDLGYDTSNLSGLFRLKQDLSINGVPAIGARFNGSVAIGIKHQLNKTPLGNVKINIGRPEINIVDDGIPLPDEISPEFIFTNDDDEPEVNDFSYVVSEKTSTTQTVTISSSIKIGGSASVSIPIVEGLKGTFNADLTLGGSLANSINKESTKEYQMTTRVRVPANSERSVIVVTSKSRSKVNYFIPITFTGNVQTNYLIPVNWNFFHNTPITNYPNFANRVQREGGVLVIQKVDRVRVLRRKAVPLN